MKPMMPDGAEGDAHSSMQASLQASMEAEPSDAAQQVR